MPGTRVTDAHTGWTCIWGASLIADAMTTGPGKLGTLHAVIYTCPEHQAAVEKRIAAFGWNPEVRPAPPSHKGKPWPCGHITAYDADTSAEAFAEQSHR